VVGERGEWTPVFGQQVGGLMHPGEGRLDGLEPLRRERGGIEEGWSLRDCRRTRLRPWMCKERRAGRGPMPWGTPWPAAGPAPLSLSVPAAKGGNATDIDSNAAALIRIPQRHLGRQGGHFARDGRCSRNYAPIVTGAPGRQRPSPSYGRSTFCACPRAPFGRCAPAPHRLK
jgi:hypothetical protein